MVPLWLWYLVFFVGALGSLLGLLARLGWPFELVVHFRPHLVGLFFGCSAAFLWQERAVEMWIALLFGLWQAWDLGPYLPVRRGRSRGSFAVATVNVRAKNRGFASLCRWLKEARLDVVGLVEVDPGWLRALTSLESVYPHQFARPGDEDHGLAVLSRWPLKSATIVHFGDTDRPSLDVTLLVDGQPVRVLVAHPPPPFNRALMAERDAHLRRMAETARASTIPVVVMGDFNVTPWSPAFQDMLRTGGLRDTRRGMGLLPTWPAPLGWLGIPIDHVLVTGGLVPLRAQRGPDIGSDHLPLYVRLQMGEALTRPAPGRPGMAQPAG